MTSSHNHRHTQIYSHYSLINFSTLVVKRLLSIQLFKREQESIQAKHSAWVCLDRDRCLLTPGREEKEKATPTTSGGRSQTHTHTHNQETFIPALGRFFFNYPQKQPFLICVLIYTVNIILVLWCRNLTKQQFQKVQLYNRFKKKAPVWTPHTSMLYNS